MSVRLILDKTLKDKGITRYYVHKQTGINYQIVDNYYKNRVSRYDAYVLDKICKCINCDISDLIEYKED